MINQPTILDCLVLTLQVLAKVVVPAIPFIVLAVSGCVITNLLMKKSK